MSGGWTGGPRKSCHRDRVSAVSGHAEGSNGRGERGRSDAISGGADRVALEDVQDARNIERTCMRAYIAPAWFDLGPDDEAA